MAPTANQVSSHIEITPDDQERELVLQKEGQRYLFRYRPGEEARVLSGIMDLARDPDCPLTLLDAAHLCNDLGRQLGQDLHQLVRH